MARTRPSATKPQASKPTTDNGKADADATKKAKADTEAKRQQRENQEASHTQALLKRVGKHPALGTENKGESLSAVASDLSITAGKAAFLLMIHAVKDGDVPAITGKDDETLLKNINTARLKVDRFSSWGWLAARASKSEGFIKVGLEKLGLFTPKAENIASKRAELNPPKPKATKTAKPGTKRTRPKAKGNA